MAYFYANGLTSTTHNQSYFIDPDWFESRAVCPNITPAWNGQQLGLLVSCAVTVAGKFGAAQSRGWVSNTDGGDWRGTGIFGVGQGNAAFTPWFNFTSAKGFVGGQEIRYGVDQQWGTLVIGRAAVGGRNIISGNPAGLGWNGYALGMAIGYFTLPSAPGTPSLSSPTSGALNASWGAPSWNGDTDITGYRFDYSASPNFSSYTRIVVGRTPSVAITGLTPGAVIYTRVYATNAVGDFWNTVSQPSGTRSITIAGTPPAPSDPIPVVKISTAGAWVATDRINMDLGQGAWRPSDVQISNGTIWQSPIA